MKRVIPLLLPAALGLAIGLALGRPARGPAPVPRRPLDEAVAARAVELLARATGALEAGRFDESLAAAEAFLAEFGGGWAADRAHRIRRASLAGLGRFEEAASGWPLAPGPPAAASPWLDLADAVASGRPEAFAAAALRLDDDPPADVVEALGRVALDRLGPDRLPPEVDLRWSRIHRSAGRSEEQLACYDRVLTHHPDHPLAAEIAYARARLLHGTLDRPLEAEAAYRALIADHPTSPRVRQARLFAGELRVAAGDEAGAAEDFDVVAGGEERDGIWASAWISLAWTHARRGRPDRAAEILAGPLDEGDPPRAADALAARARFLRQAGDEAAARRVVERLLRDHPDSPAARRER